MWRTKIAAVALMAVLLTLGAGAVYSADAPVLERIVSNKEIRVGLSGNQPPLNATGRTGQLIGLEVDLANLLAGALGVEAKFVKKPFPQLLGALEAGEVDIVMSGVAITAQPWMSCSLRLPIPLQARRGLSPDTVWLNVLPATACGCWWWRTTRSTARLL